MRIVSYILAVVIGVAAIILGFVTKSWVVAGLGLGFLAMSIYRIIVGGQASTQGQSPHSILAVFDMPIWPDGVISIVIIAVGAGLMLLIFKLIGWV
ncbi:MAG: hypothetical protein M1434_01945 [Chloroflexi bacterium]|nr:hypothetical protein [Chloroflexota bacterium]MCL5273491.1 hypothetical protein [Chloroflexota bacterium]